jgi:hypothetical protein
MTLECKICGEDLPTNVVGLVLHFKDKHPEIPEIAKLRKELASS